MTNFNIFRVHGKIQVLEGGLTKNRYTGEDCLKRRAWTVCRFKKGGLARKRGVVFLRGVDTPMHTMRMKDLQTPFIQVIGLCEIVWNEG